MPASGTDSECLKYLLKTYAVTCCEPSSLLRHSGASTVALNHVGRFGIADPRDEL
jgi:hypothetical protein